MDLRRAISRFRADKGLSISAAARVLGIDRTLLSKLERGERSSVRQETAEALVRNSDDYIRPEHFFRTGKSRRASANSANHSH